MKHKSYGLWAMGYGLIFCSLAYATPKLGEKTPNMPWLVPQDYLLVFYSHDCGDISGVWDTLQSFRMPIYALNTLNIPSPAPENIPVLRGEKANTLSSTFKVRIYPTVLYIRKHKIKGLWESGGTNIALSLGLE